jgi:hypothetical protein
MSLTTEQAHAILTHKHAIRVGKTVKDLDGDAYTLFDVDDPMGALTWLHAQPGFDDHLFNTMLHILKLPQVEHEHLLFITGFTTAGKRYDCKNDMGIKDHSKGDHLTLHKGAGSAQHCTIVDTTPLAASAREQNAAAAAEKLVKWVMQHVH